MWKDSSQCRWNCVAAWMHVKYLSLLVKAVCCKTEHCCIPVGKRCRRVCADMDSLIIAMHWWERLWNRQAPTRPPWQKNVYKLKHRDVFCKDPQNPDPLWLVLHIKLTWHLRNKVLFCQAKTRFMWLHMHQQLQAAQIKYLCWINYAREKSMTQCWHDDHVAL